MKTKSFLIIIISAFWFVSCTNGQESKTTVSSTYQDIKVNEVMQIAEKNQAIILDVRTPEEVSQGIIEGAVNINFYDNNFMQKAKELDKTKPIIVYCKSGGRSSSAAGKLVDEGFTVYNVVGGITAWYSAGLPTVK